MHWDITDKTYEPDQRSVVSAPLKLFYSIGNITLYVPL